MTEESLRRELYESFKNRAMLYHLILEELEAEVGAERAEAILGRAIRRRGEERGQAAFASFAPSDLAGLRDAFLADIPDDGQMFKAELERDDAEALDMKFHGCPLREAWIEAGLPAEQVARLCKIASQVDVGTFEGAGFRFTCDTWQPGGDGCCKLHVRSGG